MLLIPDHSDRWCWSQSQWSLGRSLDRSPVHQSPVHLMFMDHRNKTKRENPLRREENGWESNPQPAWSDVTAVPTVPFSASSFGKIHQLSRSFSSTEDCEKHPVVLTAHGSKHLDSQASGLICRSKSWFASNNAHFQSEGLQSFKPDYKCCWSCGSGSFKVKYGIF